MFMSLLDLMRQAGARLPMADGPAITVNDEGAYLVVRADLKGIDPRSVQIQIAETGLAIGGRATREEKTEGPDFYAVQSSSSSFLRQIPLLSRVEPNRAQAAWEAGESLVIRLPKR